MLRLLLLSTIAVYGQAGYETALQPFLTKNCVSCHGEKKPAAGMSLNRQSSDAALEKVLDRITAGTMPPPGLPKPSATELATAKDWLQKRLATTATPRVTARRLNRVEYNNTIRDLLGVAARPADEFPVDDSGYGFDNIGDVLTVSPMLMEKYLAAANKVSKLAVYGEALPPKPTRLARLLNRRSPDSNDVLSNGNYLPYSLRGAMYGAWNFPVDGEYEFRLRVANFRPNPPVPRVGKKAGPPTDEEVRDNQELLRNSHPARKVVLTVDGRTAVADVVEGSTAYGYNRGEFIGRLKVSAGEHQLRASFPELADLASPRLNINPDQRRQLFIDYLEIVGPYQPVRKPPSFMVCQANQPGCARRIVENLARRAYRRPVTAAEVDSKLKLVNMALQDGEPFEEAIRVGLEAILASPHFLFRMEQPGLTEHDLASRLSYFLWGSMPDDALFQVAAKGQLRQPAVLEAQVRRMLADPKAANLVDNFAAQWLQLRSLGRTKPDASRFPTVDDELLDAMRRETSLFVNAVVREDRSVLDFIDAPFTYLNGPLARHYGIAGVNGEAFRRVPLDGLQRSGLITQGAILTVSSYPTRTSPPVRGKWVLENLLGAAPPPPPPEVPVLDESKLAATMSMRERLEMHRKDPSCAPCHNAMDPIGFGLESYDAVGAYRTHDGAARIDTAGVLPSGQAFQSVSDLKKILRGQSGEFTHNLAEKLLTFALGRGLERSDRPLVDQISQQVAANNYRFSSLVLGIVRSPAFQSQGAN